MDEQEQFDKVCNPIFNEIGEKLDKILLSTNGPDDHPELGLKMRVRDLEQAKEKEKNIVRLIVKNWWIILIVLMSFFSFIKNGKINEEEMKKIIQRLQVAKQIVSP